MTEPFLAIDAATVREEFKDCIRRLQLLPEEVAVLDDIASYLVDNDED